MASLDLYIIPTRTGRPALFSPHDSLVMIEVDSTDRVRQFIDWLAGRRNRIVAWVGRGIRSLHDYYLKVEDKIDPVEMAKCAAAMAIMAYVIADMPERLR